MIIVVKPFGDGLAIELVILGMVYEIGFTILPFYRDIVSKYQGCIIGVR